MGLHQPGTERNTTGKPVFAVRQNLCRAFYFGRTAKSLFAVRFLYSARQRKNARQTSYLPCAWRKRTAKILFAVRFYYSARHIFLPLRIPSNPNVILLKILCRAHYFRRTANSCVCRAFLL
jgi:hypothetical protein